MDRADEESGDRQFYKKQVEVSVAGLKIRDNTETQLKMREIQ